VLSPANAVSVESVGGDIFVDFGKVSAQPERAPGAGNARFTVDDYVRSISPALRSGASARIAEVG